MTNDLEYTSGLAYVKRQIGHMIHYGNA